MKKNLAALLSLLLSLSLLAAVGIPASLAAPVEIPTLRIAFSPYADADEITTATEPLEELLQVKLLEKGYDVDEVEMTVGTNYAAVGNALSAGSADIGFMSGGNYVLYSDDCDVLLTTMRYAINKDSENPADWNDGTIEENTDEMSTYYRCIVLAGPTEKGQALAAKVNAGEELSWEELNDATWAVLNPTSASGYIYPCLWLLDHFDKSISDLEHVVPCDSHSTAVARLAAGQVDVMVSYGHIRIKNAPKWEEEYGASGPMAEQTAVIGVTQGIYNDMIAWSKTSELMQDANFRQALGESFIELAETEEGQAVFSVFSQIGYTWGSDADYDGERAAQELLRSLDTEG
ncbi:MAG: PhnD/SsuA/transferrin family substrate-binding protein [Oscillospiraceae bacterium]|nr:PhnD/SsuA/transferrin family substrate-binding protein [Oscillospiraceae bacterium]